MSLLLRLIATTPVVPPAVVQQGGGWLSEEQTQDYRKRRDKKRDTVRELERQIERAYQRIQGIEEPETASEPTAPAEKAQVVIARAEQLAAALTAKANDGERFNAEASGFLSNINRLLAIVKQERIQREHELKLEEEAIVLLLAA